MKASRNLPGERGLRIGVRTLHIGAIAVIFGAAILNQSYHPRLILAWFLAFLTGILFISHDAWRYGSSYFHSVMFWGIFCKMLCLVIAYSFPASQIWIYSIVLVIGSIVSHMPGKYRHKNIFARES